MRIERLEHWVAHHWLFARITTECGTTGIGEATYFPCPPAVAAVLEELRGDIVGADARRPEWLFQRLWKHHCILDAVQMAALSAVDQAIWDAKGRKLDVPVHELLGGRVRDRVRAIVLVEADDEATLVAAAVAARDDGFTAMKIKPFVGDWAVRGTAAGIARVAETCRAVRDAVGEEVDVAIEVHRNLTPDRAIGFAHDVAIMRPYFIEDPILPFSVASAAHLGAHLPGTLALAERNTNIFEFREFSDIHGVAILRPDIGLAGGYTQLRKIAAIAESRHQRIVPHNFTSPVATAGHIQLAACTVNWDVQGYVREDRAPWNRAVRTVNRVENGFLLIPDAPGTGIELDVDWIAAAPYEPFGSRFQHGVALGSDGGIRHL